MYKASAERWSEQCVGLGGRNLYERFDAERSIAFLNSRTESNKYAPGHEFDDRGATYGGQQCIQQSPGCATEQ